MHALQKGKYGAKELKDYHQGVLLKRPHVGSGGRFVKMIVAISYRKGVIYCERYGKLDGDYYENCIHRNFRKMFRKSGNLNSK